MTTEGYGCYFEEKLPGYWYLFVAQNNETKGGAGEYDKHGPYKSFGEAEIFLINNFPNPHGYEVYPHPNGSDVTWVRDQPRTDDEWQEEFVNRVCTVDDAEPDEPPIIPPAQKGQPTPGLSVVRTFVRDDPRYEPFAAHSVGK